MNIDDNLRVEVSHGHRLFPAIVIDADGDLITVQYQDGTNQSIKSEPGKLRKSHHCNNNLAITPEIVQQLVPQETYLEIKSSSTISTEQSVTSQPLECWERMRFVAKAGENLIILSAQNETSNTQVLDLSAQGDNIRLPNSKETTIAGDDWSSEHCCVHFEHMKIEDENVQELCKNSPSVNDEFCKRIGAQKIYFNAVNETLVVVHNMPDTVKPRLDLFKVHHLGSLSRMAIVAKRVQEQQELLHDEQSQARFTGEVKVSIELARFGILDRVKGKFYHGKRIREAKKTTDVVDIFVQVFPQGNGDMESIGYVVIRIVAKTQAALDQSSSMLRFTEQTVYIPNEYTTRVIGKDGTLIQDLIDKCGILRVAVVKQNLIPDDCIKNNITPFVLIGLESKLESAKALIDYQISYLQQEENLEAKFKNLQVEIRKVRGHFLNTDGETDRQTDSDSGYKTNLTSWAVEESPPPEDLIEDQQQQQKSNQVQKKAVVRPGSAKNNNRNRRKNNTDTEFTDTEANQSDAAPAPVNQSGVPSFAQLLNPNSKSPRAVKPDTKASGDKKIEKPQQLDMNNNVVGNGDAKVEKPYKKPYNNNNNYKKPAQENNSTGDKPLPQRNNNKRQNRNKKYQDNKQQAPQAQVAQ